MALVFKDRVNVTSTTEGVGVFTLGSAAIGYQDFSAIGNGNTVYYTISSQTGTEWEVGIGTYTALGSLLSRDSVLSSSNSGALVPFTAGVKNVFVTYPAEKAVSLDATQTLTNKTINGSSNTITNVSLSTGVTGTLPAANGGTGLTSPGTSGNMLVSNGTAWTSQAVSASPSIQAVASGSLSDGTKVVVNSDGTVSAVSYTAGSGGAVSNITASTSYYPIASCYCSRTNTVWVAYADTSSYGYVARGVISGSTISFDTNTLFSTASQNVSIAFDSGSNYLVVVYMNPNTGQTFYVGAYISATAPYIPSGFGTPYAVGNGFYVRQYSSVYVPSQGVIFSASANGTAVSGYYYYTGSVISYGGTASTERPASVARPTSNKVLVVYQGAGSNGRYCVFTVSSTSVTAGTAGDISGAVVYYGISACYDVNADKYVVTYRDYTNSSGYGAVIVGTMSGSTMTWGTPTIFTSQGIGDMTSTVYNPTKKSITIVYNDTSGYLTELGGVVSGSTIGLFTPNIVYSTYSYTPTMAYDASQQKMVANFFRGSNVLSSIVITPSSTTLTPSNFIGISNGAYSNGQTATVQVVGSVDDAQSGLTAGNKYYVSYDGSLTSSSGINPYAGVAVSSTKLLIKG